MGLFDALIGAGSSAQSQQFARTNYKNRYKWTMEDMRNAGLNPILAGQVGGGSSPPAASTQPSGTSALQGMQILAQTKLLKQQTRKTSAEASIAEGDVPIAGLKGEMTAKGIATGRRLLKNVKLGVEEHNTTQREATSARRNYQSSTTTRDGQFRFPPIGRTRGGRR